MATKTQKTLAVGAAAGAAILAAYLVNKAAAAVSSCDPYILFVNEGAEHPLQYYRFDGTTRPLTSYVAGHYFDSLGGQHVQGYALDWGQGMMEVPVASGVEGADGWPYPTFPAPPIDALVEHQPPEGGVTVCGNYAKWNGPHAKPCPSNPSLYTAAIKAVSGVWKTDPLCGHFPTPTPTGGVPQSPTPTKPPATLVASPVPMTPTPSPYADWVEALYNEGITSGCGPGVFCPTQPVTREQIAVFLLRVKHGSTYVPPKCVGLFTDVPCK